MNFHLFVPDAHADLLLGIYEISRKVVRAEAKKRFPSGKNLIIAHESSFGKMVSEDWRRQMGKWFTNPIVHVTPQSFRRFKTEILQGRVDQTDIDHLDALYEAYTAERKKHKGWKNGRVHWTPKEAHQEFEKLGLETRLAAALRDPDALDDLMDAFVEDIRINDGPPAALGRAFALAAIATPHKFRNDETKSHTLYQVASCGSYVSYQCGDLRGLTRFEGIREQAQQTRQDPAHTVLGHIQLHLRNGLVTHGDERNNEARSAYVIHCESRAPTRYPQQGPINHWLLHNSLVPMVDGKLDPDYRLDYAPGNPTLASALSRIVDDLADLGNIEGAAIAATTEARAMTAWGQFEAAQVKLATFSESLRRSNGSHHVAQGNLHESRGDLEAAIVRTRMKEQYARDTAAPWWEKAKENYRASGSRQRYDRVEFKLAQTR